MPRYRLTWDQTTTHTAYVDAVSESAARQAWIDGDYDGEDVSDPDYDLRRVLPVKEAAARGDRA